MQLVAAMEKPEWAEGSGLSSVGTYYEGFVDNLDDILEKHKIGTLTSYGTRTSHKRKKQNTQSEESSPKVRHASCLLLLLFTFR